MPNFVRITQGIRPLEENLYQQFQIQILTN